MLGMIISGFHTSVHLKNAASLVLNYSLRFGGLSDKEEKMRRKKDRTTTEKKESTSTDPTERKFWK